MGLKFRLQQLGKFFFIWWVFFLSFLIQLLWWPLWSDNEYVLGITEILWVSIKDISSVLTVVSLESPSYSLVNDVIWNSFILSITSNEFFYFFFNCNSQELIIRVTINLDNNWLFWGRWLSLSWFSWFFSIIISISRLIIVILCLFSSLFCSLKFFGSLFPFKLSLFFNLLDLDISISFKFFPLVLLFLIPSLQFINKGTYTDVRHIVVISHLLSKE